jgi:hypothetical protein
VSLIKTNRTTGGAAAIGARARDAAAQAIPAGKRAGTTAVQGVRQGVQDARDWAAPRLEDAVHGAKDWAAPRLGDAVHGARDWAAPRLEEAVHGAREWAAPRLEEAADAVTGTVAPKVAETVTGTLAPKVSSALRSTARQVRPSGSSRTGIRRLLRLRWLLGLGAVAAAAGAGAAVAMRRRYANATAEAKNDAAESPETQAAPPPGESAADAARRSEVNGRVSAPDA